MTEGLINNERGNFRAGRMCVDQIFTVKQIGVKAREKKCTVYVGFMDLEKSYDKVNMEALWQVLRMNNVGDKLLNKLRLYILILKPSSE